jgi:energy-coupling factor transporter ATP-binding protein EcfA2
MLKIQNLSFRFNADLPLFFNAINSEFQVGKVHALTGKNGAGKSTLFRLLQGIVYHDEQIAGRVYLNGSWYDLAIPSERSAYSEYVKTVCQDVRQMIAPEYTVYENMQLAALGRYPGLVSLPYVEVPGLLAEQLYPLYHTPAFRLSGGQRALLALGMIVQKGTQVLLLDEPTAALDPANAILVMQYINQLAVELSMVVLVITHDSELTNQYTTGTTLAISLSLDGQRTIECL